MCQVMWHVAHNFEFFIACYSLLKDNERYVDN